MTFGDLAYAKTHLRSSVISKAGVVSALVSGARVILAFLESSGR